MVATSVEAETARAWELFVERGIWAFFVVSTLAIVILLETIFLNKGCSLQ